MSVSVKLDGDTEKLLDKLKGLSSIDKRSIFNNIGESLRTSTVERFREEKSPEGEKWKTSIRASDKGDKTLTDSADLRNSIRKEASEKGVAIGTNTIYAATHQFGDSRTIRAKKAPYLRFKINGAWCSVKEVSVTIPARPFIGLSKDDKEEINEIIMDAIQGAGEK